MAAQPQEWTLNGLSIELGMDSRKIAKMIVDVEPVRKNERSNYYRMADVVQAIIGNPEQLDLTLERAKLAKAHRQIKEMDIKLRNEELLPAEEVLAAWQGILANVRAKLLALPTKCAVDLAAEDSRAKCQEILRAGVYEALTELSETGKK